MKVIDGNRRKLEKEVIDLLVRNTDPKELDKAIAKLKPRGQLKLIYSTNNKHTKSE